MESCLLVPKTVQDRLRPVNIGFTSVFKNFKLVSTANWTAGHLDGLRPTVQSLAVKFG